MTPSGNQVVTGAGHVAKPLELQDDARMPAYDDQKESSASRMIVRELLADEVHLWDALVAGSPQHTIFAQRWWIDVITEGAGKLLGCFQGKRLLAGLPIWPTTRLGVRQLRQPPLTPYWGPVFQQLEGKYVTRLNLEMSVLRAFARAIAPWQDVAMSFHPSLTNWLPFYWQHYAQTTRYTYRIDDLSTLSDAMCHNTVRAKIKRAVSAGVRVVDITDPEVLLRMYELTMQRQGLAPSAGVRRLWPAIARAAAAQDRLSMIAAVGKDGQVHFARALVWDDRCAYGLMAGGDPRFSASSGGTLTQWHRIQHAATLVRSYDFEGSVREPIETFFRQFGGVLTPYMIVTRASSPRLNAARFAQRIVDHFAHHPRKRPPTGDAG